MLMRRTCALVLSTAACAYLLMFTAPTIDMMTAHAPQSVGVSADAGADATMAALHRQANDALARLQAAAARNK